MPQSLASRPQSVIEPRQALIELCDRIVRLWNENDLPSRAMAQALQRILNELDEVPIPPNLRDQVLRMRNEIVAWDREEETLEAIVDQAVALIDADYEPPAKPKVDPWAPDPSIVVELTDNMISITKGGHICGLRLGTPSYKATFDRYSAVNLPAYPLCRLRTATTYLEHYAQGGRYLVKA